MPTMAAGHEPARRGPDDDVLAAELYDKLHYSQAIPSALASRHDWYMALALVVRDRLLDGYLRTIDAVLQSRTKVVAYLSAEFLTGPHLGNNLINLGMWDAAAQALRECRAGPRRRCSSRRRSRASATAASAGSRRATWTRWRRSTSRDRLRHPLRVRHLRSGHPRRLRRWS